MRRLTRTDLPEFQNGATVAPDDDATHYYYREGGWGLQEGGAGLICIKGPCTWLFPNHYRRTINYGRSLIHVCKWTTNAWLPAAGTGARLWGVWAESKQVLEGGKRPPLPSSSSSSPFRFEGKNRKFHINTEKKEPVSTIGWVTLDLQLQWLHKQCPHWAPTFPPTGSHSVPQTSRESSSAFHWMMREEKPPWEATQDEEFKGKTPASDFDIQICLWSTNIPFGHTHAQLGMCKLGFMVAGWMPRDWDFTIHGEWSRGVKSCAESTKSHSN